MSEKEVVSSVQGCGGGRVQRRRTGVKVVRERAKRGGEDGRGEREGGKMTSVQEDREVKTQLVMEAQKKEDPSQIGKVRCKFYDNFCISRQCPRNLRKNGS